MTETSNFFSRVDPVELRNNAEKNLRDVLEGFDVYEIDAVGLMMSCTNLWDNMMSNKGLRSKLDREIEKRQKVVTEISGDQRVGRVTVRDRYDPNQWLMNIPPELINDKYTYLRDKAKSLLELIAAVK